MAKEVGRVVHLPFLIEDEEVPMGLIVMWYHDSVLALLTCGAA